MKKHYLGVLTAFVTTVPMLTVVACGNNEGGGGLPGTKNPLAGRITIKRAEFLNKTLPDDFMLPETITTIEKDAFRGATLNNKFKIPKSITKIGESAFQNASLNYGFSVPDIANIDKNAFLNTDWMPDEFVIPEGTTEIKEKQFYRKVIPNGFYIPKSVTKIGKLAFNGATIPMSARISDNITELGISSFGRSTLPSNFKIPKKIVELKNYTFAAIKSNKLEKLIIPKSVKKLGIGSLNSNHFGKKTKLIIENEEIEISPKAFIGSKFHSKFTLPAKAVVMPEAFNQTEFFGGLKIPGDVTFKSYKDYLENYGGYQEEEFNWQDKPDWTTKAKKFTFQLLDNFLHNETQILAFPMAKILKSIKIDQKIIDKYKLNTKAGAASLFLEVSWDLLQHNDATSWVGNNIFQFLGPNIPSSELAFFPADVKKFIIPDEEYQDLLEDEYYPF